MVVASAALLLLLLRLVVVVVAVRHMDCSVAVEEDTLALADTVRPPWDVVVVVAVVVNPVHPMNFAWEGLVWMPVHPGVDRVVYCEVWAVRSPDIQIVVEGDNIRPVPMTTMVVVVHHIAKGNTSPC